MDSPGGKGTRRRIEPGIFSDRYGHAVVVKIGRVQCERRFKPNTTIRTLRKARKALREEMIAKGHTPRDERRRGGDGAGPLWVPPIFKECDIYFVVIGEAVKIGRAADVNQRMRDLQVSHHLPISPSAVAHGTHATEKRLHRHFAADRIRGEWFKLTPELARLIAQLREGADIQTLLPA
jgi:hypothetical protein